MPRAFSAAYSPDGRRIAYEEFQTAFIPDWYEASMWRHYRGGRTHPISVMNLTDHSVEKLPGTTATIRNRCGSATRSTSFPINHTANLFAYRTDTKQLTQLTQHDDFDIMTASAGADAIVYEQAGYIHLVDAKGGKSTRLNIEATGDLPGARQQFKKVASMIRNYVLSPTGVRAASKRVARSSPYRRRKATIAISAARAHTIVHPFGLLTGPNSPGCRTRVVNTNW